MQQIKVLHAHASLRSGGVAVLLYNYYSKMDHSLIQFDHIINVPDIGMIGEKFSKEGSKIYHLPRFNKVIATFIGTRRVIKNGNYKIVHVHHTQKSFVQLIAAWTCRVPVRIAHSHNYYTNESMIQKVLNRCYSLLTMLFATHYFACSDLAGEYVYGSHCKKIKKIYNAIDVPAYRIDKSIRERIRKDLKIEGKFVLCHVGRMTHQKNPIRIVDIFDKVVELNKESVLIWIGTGELENDIKEHVKRKRLTHNIIFIGETDRVNEYLMASDLFLLPSLYEGLGIVLIEAQVSGLPCIASDVIPKEVKVTPMVEFISLEEKDDTWAEVILQHSNYKRQDYSKEVIASGYDLNERAADLQKWYIERKKKQTFFQRLFVLFV